MNKPDTPAPDRMSGVDTGHWPRMLEEAFPTPEWRRGIYGPYRRAARWPLRLLRAVELAAVVLLTLVLAAFLER